MATARDVADAEARAAKWQAISDEYRALARTWRDLAHGVNPVTGRPYPATHEATTTDEEPRR